MDNPRPEKVAVVDEVRERLESADAVLLTEYRGVNVSEMATLRRALREAGGEYKIYKNTLVRFAAQELGLDLDDQLVGPTAIAFVPRGGGDPVTVAKALRDFARSNPSLVMKGGVLGEKLLSADDAKALAEVAPREELLSKLAGLMAAPMQQMAGLLQAVPRNFAYGLAALVEQGGAPGAPAPAEPSADDSTAGDSTAGDSTADDSTADDSTAGDTAADGSTAGDSAAADSTTDTPEAAADPDATPDDSAPADAAADTQES